MIVYHYRQHQPRLLAKHSSRFHQAFERLYDIEKVGEFAKDWNHAGFHPLQLRHACILEERGFVCRYAACRKIIAIPSQNPTYKSVLSTDEVQKLHVTNAKVLKGRMPLPSSR